jgi:tetratricopeptide (TPR) repeat protein
MRVARLSRFLGAWTLLGLCASGATLAQAQGLHDTRGEALRLYDAGRYQEALPLFDEVLRRKPRDLDSLNKRACIYIRMNQPERAIADLDQAIRYKPFLAYDQAQMVRQFAPDVQIGLPPQLYSSVQLYPSAFTNRGVALMMLGRDDEALADFQRSISIRLSPPEPRFSPYYKKWRIGMAAAYCGVGQVYHHRGDDARALEAYDQAIHYNPDDPNGHVGRANSLAARGEFGPALSSFGEALRLDPNHSRAYGYRASALERLGRVEDAVADYDASIRLDPNVPTTHRLRAALLSQLGRHAQAIPDLDAAIRLDPKDASAYKDRGGVYNRLGDPARALDDLDTAVRLDPKSSRAYQNRAAAYNGLGRFDRALADCNEAVRLDPQNPGALNNRGVALTGLGRFGRAIDDLTESIRLDPGQVAAYVNRGLANTRYGLPDEAVADFEAALRRAPNLAAAEAGMAQARSLLSSLDRSGREGLALRQTPPESAAYTDLGNSRRSSGDWSGAIAEYSRAIEADPKNAEALAFRGWSRACAGEPGAESDARAWLDLNGWRDPFAPYMALLGVVAARQAGRAPAASDFLDEALANTHPPAWPAPLFRYLKRTTPSTDLLSAADSPDKQTEAHTVIALDLLHRGEPGAAVEHLRWVRDHGLDRSIAKDLALETLRRLEAAGPPAGE